MTKLIRILVLEHDSNDIELLHYELKRSDLPVAERVVQTKHDFTQALLEERPDVILSDYSLPSFDAMSAFAIKQELCPDVPFIIVSGTIGDANAVELIKTGVTDYVLKENIYQITHKIKRALAETEERRQRNLAIQQLQLREQELRTQHELVSNILDTISDGFFAMTTTSEVTYWNNMAEILLGVPKEKIVGMSPWEVFGDVMPPKFTAAYNEVVTSQVSLSFDDYLAYSDSWFEVSLSYSNNRVVVFFRDITAKKRKEQLDMLEKEMLELYTLHDKSVTTAITYLLNGIKGLYPEMSFTLSKVENGRMYNWVNPHLAGGAGQADHGFDIHTAPWPCARAAAQKQVVEVLDLPNQEAWKEYARLMAPHDIQALISYPLYDVNKKVIGVLAVLFKQNRPIKPTEERAVMQAMSILRQLVESQLAEAAIRKSEEKYRNLFHASPTPMWVYDTETFKFLEVNAAAISHYGYSEAEFKNMTLFDIRPREEHQALAASLALTDELGTFPKTLFTHRTKTGELIWVDVQANTIEVKGRKARVVLATDVTENIKHTRAIENQNTMLREIAWMQSHVMRAPVARIMGLAALLSKSETNPAMCRQIVNYIQESTKELDTVIRTVVHKAEQLDVYSQPDASSAPEAIPAR
jgi:PAS domain S-box-containing protein